MEDVVVSGGFLSMFKHYFNTHIYGIGQAKFLEDVCQSYPARPDMIVLDSQLRICRGNAGTTFALLKQSAISVEEFLG